MGGALRPPARATTQKGGPMTNKEISRTIMADPPWDVRRRGGTRLVPNGITS